MHLTIKSMTKGDEGEYYCHAENNFGNDTQPVSVRIRNVVSLVASFVTLLSVANGAFVTSTIMTVEEF